MKTPSRDRKRQRPLNGQERSDRYERRQHERQVEQRAAAEERKSGFRCGHCGKWVASSEFIGTRHRNHCPFCLWSKHVDLKKPGDRGSKCGAGMRPIGLTHKKEARGKYGAARSGELMVVHGCTLCGGISKNRLAADDDPAVVVALLQGPERLGPLMVRLLDGQSMPLLTDIDRDEAIAQLFGSVRPARQQQDRSAPPLRKDSSRGRHWKP